METVSLHFLNLFPETAKEAVIVIDLVVLLYLTTWNTYQFVCDVVDEHDGVCPAH